MIFFPNAKINIGLYITDKRSDGFHNLETVFIPLPYYDAVELIASEENKEQHQFQFSSSGLIIDSPVEKNLCYRAWQLIKNDFPGIPPVKLHLHKIIPMGAGLGGGSADAAFTLKLFNEKFDLGISDEKILEYALKLGSDCPFFIKNKTSIASGRGENLQPVQLTTLKGFHVVTIFPGIHISTAWAFSKVLIQHPDIPLQDMILRPAQTWKNAIKNNFEPAVFEEFPVIGEIKDALYKAGAVYASMSGSGSTVFALFRNEHFKLPQFPDNYIVNSMKFRTADT